MDALAKYLLKLKSLRVDKSHGIAPHKPILLLSVLLAFQNNLITSPKVYLTPELVALFKANWSLLVTSNHDCRISYPFYYLKSEKFWHLTLKPGFDNIDKLGTVVKSFSTLNAAVDYAWIDDDLFYLANDHKSNRTLVQFLLDEYFPHSINNLRNSLGVQQKLFEDIEGKILNEGPAEYRMEIKKLMQQQNEEEIFLRGSVFKREIPKIYNNTCCISGMKIDAAVSISMVDACHIVPFSESYDDTITNGIALCPNLHRAFDRGLITIDGNYEVIVSKLFREEDSNYSIRIFEGKKVNLPREKKFQPLIINLEWHQKNIFKV